MNKTTLFTLLATAVLLLSQFYWLYSLYTEHANEYSYSIDRLLFISIERELNTRWSNKSFGCDNPKYVVRFGNEMTAAERAKLGGGDTVTIKRADRKKLGGTLSEILSQVVQDKLFYNKPIRLNVVDSIFGNLLKEKGLNVAYRISLFGKDSVEKKSTVRPLPRFAYYVDTDMKPIGTKGLLYVQAHVGVPVEAIFKKMLLALIVSGLMIVLVLICLYRQLSQIRNMRKELEGRETLMYHAIHDLKGPLNSAYLLLDSVVERNLEEKERNIMNRSKNRIERLIDMITHILDSIKGEKTDIVKNNVDLPELINNVWEMTMEQHRDRKCTFNIINESGINDVQVDSYKLERCLINLLDNALKYADDGVIVSVKLSEIDKELHIAIADTGWGIERKYLKRIGKKFFRIERGDKPTVKGFGLGLSSVKRQLSGMNGRLLVESGIGKGSTFTIIIPQ